MQRSTQALRWWAISTHSRSILQTLLCNEWCIYFIYGSKLCKTINMSCPLNLCVFEWATSTSNYCLTFSCDDHVQSSRAGSHYSLLQQPLRRQTQTQMQQMSTNATKPAAPDINIVIFSGSKGMWWSSGWSFMGQWNMTCKHYWRVALNHLQSMTFNCWATQLLGAPTLLEDSQRYIPESVLDTLFNFCCKQRQKA